MTHPVALVTEPSAAFGDLADDAWLEVLVRSIDEPVVDGVALPGFPSAEFQIRSVGSAGGQALGEAFQFWKLVRDIAAREGRALSRGSRVLDFGCGWGRMVRFFLRDLRGADVWGADVGRDMFTFCREHFPAGRFVRVQPAPPTKLPAASFDVVYAYSVFSHLNEEVSRAWVEDLARTLKPGGLFIATTQARRFITRCEDIRRGGRPANGWEESLARLFPDQDAVLSEYDCGDFVHAATGGGEDRPATFYGESVVPRRYVERVWSRWLEPIDFVDDPSVANQAVIVMRKESGP